MPAYCCGRLQRANRIRNKPKLWQRAEQKEC
nr:MAG TPA: hypothetical protein [Caudoviricetes sp.]